MPTPTVEGDIVLGTSGVGILLTSADLSGPVASTTSGAYWAWVEDFNPMPAVDMATNDTPVVFDFGTRPGGDIPLARRYQFEFYAQWESTSGLAQLMSDVTTVAQPLTSGTTEMSFMFGGLVWTVTGRYEPMAMGNSQIAVAHGIASFLVRFRATDPVIRSGGNSVL